MEIYSYVVVDTSSLMNNLEPIEELLQSEVTVVVIPSIVLEELDNHKDGANRYKSFMARRALKLLDKYSDVIDFVVSEELHYDINELMEGYDMSKPDNKIIAVALLKDFYNTEENATVSLMTNDMGMRVKAELLDMDVINTDTTKEINYKGYRWFKGYTEDEIDQQLYAVLDQLMINEYIIEELYDEYGESTITISRFTGNDFAELHIPKSSKVKPENVLQECLLDMLWNTSIPVKIVQGVYGSGKTYVSTKVAKQLLDKRYFDTLLLVRNPVPVDGVEIGALPGDKHDKVGAYFKCMLQYLQDEEQLEMSDLFDTDINKYGNNIICEIPAFMKGTSYDRTIMLVDECEDLSDKTIQMIGTRLGKGSAVVFMGDFKQAEKGFIHNNGVKMLIDQLAGNPMVGILALDRDVRSDVSRLFAELDF